MVSRRSTSIRATPSPANTAVHGQFAGHAMTSPNVGGGSEVAILSTVCDVISAGL